MVDYKTRTASGNVADIRTGRGSPDDRQEQVRKRNRYEDDAWATRTLDSLGSRNDPPLPRPDPRTKMPGGELGIGKDMSRGEFYQKNAEDVWIAQAAEQLATKHYHTKFLGIFGLAPKEYLGGMGSSTWTRTGNKEASRFLLDTFKRARSVGYPVHTINKQPEPLPQKFKAKQ